MLEKIAIIGGGSWGTAIGQVFASNGHEVLIYVRDKELKENINKLSINTKYFPEIKLSDKIRATDSLEEAVLFGKIIVLAVPTYVNRQILASIKNIIKKDQVIVSTAKGMEEGTFLRNSQIIKEYTDTPLVVLSGPSHAEEVMRELPTTVVAAGEDRKAAQLIQQLMSSSKFRVYTNPDIIGVEIAGAIKNVIAIAAGISDGLGYGDNTKAALITRGLYEMSKIGISMGGELLTFAGLSGMGDLVVTCTSKYSRNRNLGVKIGEGLTLNEALEEIKQTVEGVRTIKAFYEWYHKTDHDYEIPITSQIYKVLFEKKTPLQAVDDLMLRDPKEEIKVVEK